MLLELDHSAFRSFPLPKECSKSADIPNVFLYRRCAFLLTDQVSAICLYRRLVHFSHRSLSLCFDIGTHHSAKRLRSVINYRTKSAVSDKSSLPSTSKNHPPPFRRRQVPIAALLRKSAEKSKFPRQLRLIQTIRRYSRMSLPLAKFPLPEKPPSLGDSSGT